MSTSSHDVQYCCTFVEKTAEEDDFEKGCVGKRTTVLAQECNVSALTLKELVKKLENEFFVKMDYLFIAEHSEPVEWISCNQLETDDCTIPTEQESESWKKGELKLFLCDYTFHVERRMTSPIEFGEFAALGIQIE